MSPDPGRAGIAGEAADIRLVIPGDPVSVRLALHSVTDALATRGVTESDRGTAEIVLAEVLNNIVEHAYASSGGEIEVTIRLMPGDLHCRVVDKGVPMPGGLPPPGVAPTITSGEDLAEGGFGWFMIRSLSQDLSYQRCDGRNLLHFRLVAAPRAG